MPISNPIALNSSSQNLIEVPFSWGDATPKLIAEIAPDRVITTATILILVPFNGLGASLMLGDSGMLDRLIATDQNDPTFLAEYETNPGYSYSIATELVLTITPGEGCNQGEGLVLLEVN